MYRTKEIGVLDTRFFISDLPLKMLVNPKTSVATKTIIRIIFENIYTPTPLYDFYYWLCTNKNTYNNKFELKNNEKGVFIHSVINNKLHVKRKISEITLLKAIELSKNLNLRPTIADSMKIHEFDKRNISFIDKYGLFTLSYEHAKIKGKLFFSPFDKKKVIAIKRQNKTIKKAGNFLYEVFPLEILPYSFIDMMILKSLKPKPIIDELKDLEVEAKFKGISTEDYKRIYTSFKKGKKFSLEENFPYVFKRYLFVSFLNDTVRYIYPEGGAGGKIRVKFPISGIKKDKRYAILVRKELDMNYFLSINEINSEKFLKGKLMFWVENKNTKRVYHVVLDKELSPSSKYLSQLEIEYVGVLGHKKQKVTNINDVLNQIFADISEIADYINNEVVKITSTFKTKYEWFYKRVSKKQI